MSENRPANGQSSEFMRGVLIIVAILVFAGGCGIAGLTLWDGSEHPGTPPGLTISLALTALLVGAILAALLFTASAILGVLSAAVRKLNTRPVEVDDVRPALGRLEQSLRMLNNLPGPMREAVSASSAGGGANLAPLLEQLRDFTLMSDAQRERFAARHWVRRRDALTELIERDGLIGDWAAAFNRLEDLQLLLPDDPKVAELRERVESEQSSRLEEDMRAAQGQFRHLVSIASWQQAEELASELQRKYPGKAEPMQLAEDVRREREAYERENMERLFRDVAAATERRQWRPAVLALEEFIRRYPGDPRAEALRMDLPTLMENAAAHERKEQEESFKDLLKRQRYNEAIAVARAVVQKYPNSPTAMELNKLLPRVEEMARQEAARQAAAAQQTVAAPVA